MIFFVILNYENKRNIFVCCLPILRKSINFFNSLWIDKFHNNGQMFLATNRKIMSGRAGLVGAGGSGMSSSGASCDPANQPMDLVKTSGRSLESVSKLIRLSPWLCV